MAGGSGDAMTYVPKEVDAERLSALLASLEASPTHAPHAELRDADGTAIELPPDVFDALLDVVRAMANGRAISVIPRDQLLTTQEAADFLGISRPTLVKLLERGSIDFARHGRHRRVRLADVLAYEQAARKQRSDGLDEMAREGQAAGLYEATAGPPPRTR